MRIPSGKTDQVIYFIARDSNTRGRKTGLSSFTVYRSRNGAAATLYTTPTITELSAANMPGVYALLIDEDTTLASTSSSEEYAVHITASTMLAVTRTIELYRAQTFTVAGKVDANITHVNSIAVTGSGTAGSPWGP